MLGKDPVKGADGGEFLFSALLALFFEFVQLLGCQSGLCYHISGFRETVIQGIPIADADHIADLIPQIVRIKTVVGKRTLLIAQLSLAACEQEAVFIMGQTTGANHIDGFIVHHHADVYIHIQLVCAVFQFLLDQLPLPCVPIGDVDKLCVAVQGSQITLFCQLVNLAAVVAGESRSLAFGLSLCVAMGTAVEDSVQSVCPERLVDGDIVFLLPCKMVKAEGFIQNGIQLGDGFFFDFFGGSTT